MTNWAEERKKREEGVLYVFKCSGREVRLRPLDFQMFVVYGDIPDQLTSTVNKLLGEGVTDETEVRQRIKADVEFLANMGRLQQAFAKAAIVWPRIVDNPQADDEISIADLYADELTELWEFGNDPILQLHLFRPEQAVDGDGVRNRKGNRASAE